MAQHFHPIPVAAVTREAEDAVAVRLAVPADLKAVFAFKPGQHLTLRRELNGVDERRSYSLCSGVLDDQWRLGIRSVPGGAFSTWATESLRAGDVLECMTPDGSFFPLLDAAHAKHYLLIAAGSGIAYNVGRFITAAGVLAAGGLFVALGGSYTRIGAACGMVYLLGIVAIRWAPDTTGRGLIHSKTSSPSTP
jgi:NAD(P)H-flavin reductase